MKIGIFTRPIDQKTSGSGSHLLQLLEHMIPMNQDFDIHLIHYEDSRLPIYEKANHLIIPRNPLAAALKLRSQGFDLLHFSPLSVFAPVFGVNAIKVANIYGASEHFLPHQYSFAQRMHQKTIVPYYARKMDHVFTVSQASFDYIVHHYHVDPAKVSLTYCSVSDDFRKYPKSSLDSGLLQRFGIHRPFILHISKFSERKNPWVILDAFRKVCTQMDASIRPQLVLVGSGWNHPKVLAYAASHGLENDIVMTGFISRQEMIVLLNFATLFVFPSLYEGFGMPNLEAMSCGCPVVTSGVFAIPEIVGDAALIIEDPTSSEELSERILFLLHHETQRNAMIEKGLERVKMFSWRKNAQHVLSIYRQLLDGKRNSNR